MLELGLLLLGLDLMFHGWAFVGLFVLLLGVGAFMSRIRRMFQ